MGKMLKAYWSYKIFWVYWLLAIVNLVYCIQEQLISQHYKLLFIPLILLPFYEWFAHKYFLHLKISEKFPFLYKYMKRSHYAHHEKPNDPILVFAQPSLSIFLFVKFYVIFFLIFGYKVALVPMNSVFFIYLFYEWTHLGHHMEGYQHFTPLGKLMKKSHLWHHYKNENYWWGITSPIADLLLGTFPKPEDVEKSGSVKKIY